MFGITVVVTLRIFASYGPEHPAASPPGTVYELTNQSSSKFPGEISFEELVNTWRWGLTKHVPVRVLNIERRRPK